ncbi:NADH-quinone oxidoreductase subunit NuoF [Chloroflexota bacterium]
MTEKVVYKNIDKPDSETIQAYLKSGGYQVLARLAQKGHPSQVIEEIKKSSLRGCGGAGFPTGVKWEFVAQVQSSPKYIICNADEGEPGTFKDRIIMEQDPHLLIEGIAIAGFAIGAETGFIYIRGEYTLPWERLRQALSEAYEHNILGDRVFGSQRKFHIKLRRGAGSYICGEETALINSLEGKRGVPRLRPPYPTTHGLWGQPTLVNNVETLARVPAIMEKGDDWYRHLGRNGTAGTKVYCISGHVLKPGAYELPMGITARELIYDYAGGIQGSSKLKAFSPGGLSSGVLPAKMVDIPLDYDSLASAGSMLGSGAMIIMDESTCMVNMALRAARFFAHESCGECTPCRIGTERMVQLLTKITDGNGSWPDVEIIEELGKRMAIDSRCGLGQAVPLPFLSSLKHFREEYKAHIEEKECPSRVCPISRLAVPHSMQEVPL